MAAGLLFCGPGSAMAERVVTTGEGALEIAAKLIESREYDEAEAILATLAKGDPAAFDMRQVDRLAAKLAYEKGDLPRAIHILEGLVADEPDHVQTRFDLAQLLMAEREDRRAEQHFRYLLRRDPSPVLEGRVRQDLRTIDERRIVRLSFRAAAAPSTNVNAATTVRTFDLFGVIPVALDDEALAQSGMGVSWNLGGELAPPIAGRVKGHVAARGGLTDYANANFDQASAGLEAGFRLSNPSPASLGGLFAVTADRRYFGGQPYAESIGARLSGERALGRRMKLGAQLAVQDVSYDRQPQRDGLVTSVGVQALFAPARWLNTVLGLSAVREEAQSETLGNTQYGVSTGLYLSGPWKLQLGVSPTVYFREFDEIAVAYGVLREDVTLDVALRIGQRDLSLGGFTPSFVYRYTDNESTVELFSYERHSVDLGFARAF